MKYKKETSVAIIVLVSIALFYYGFNFLKGYDVFKPQKHFFAVYNHIDNLDNDNPVVLNGYKIGKVRSIELMQNPSGKLLVSFYITEDNLNIPKNSIAYISSVDILGSKAIDLKLGDSEVNAVSGDTLNAEIEEDLKTAVDRRIQPLEQKTKELISSIDSAVTIVQAILNKDARENLSSSFISIKRALKSLENTAFSLDQMVLEEKDKVGIILSHVESITNNFKKNNSSVTNILKNFSTLSDSIVQADVAATIGNANKALKDVSKLIDDINNGKGSMGQLATNDTLYNNLESASKELDLLFEDIRTNPKRYVHFSIFGRKDKNKPE